MPTPLVPAAKAILPLLGKPLRAATERYLRARSPIKLQRTLPPRCRIGMAVLAHERPEYLELCLDSLFQTRLYDYDITFLIMDDGSRDPRVREIINRPRDGYKVVRVFCEKGHNSWGAAFNRAINHLRTIGDFDILGTCDADALFHPEWLDRTMRVAQWAKAHHEGHLLGPFSSFNSSDFLFHGLLGTYATPYGNFVVKRRMGAVNYFYFKDDLQTLGLFAEHRDDETVMTERFNRLGVRNFSTETSYVEHIGQLSVLNQWRPVTVARAVYGMHLAPEGWPQSLQQVGTLGYFHDVVRSRTMGPHVESKLPLDVLIVTAGKDTALLPTVIEGVRRNLRHPIHELLIVAPDAPDLRNAAARLGCRFVSEDTLLPIGARDLHYRVAGLDRRGWLFQQLLKLAADSLGSAQSYFAIDADTVLVQPQVLEADGKELLLHSDEFHACYFAVVQQLLGFPVSALLSCVAHQMLFSKDRLRELKQHIEARSGRPWYRAILDCTDYSDKSGFSEFELYGQWCMNRYPQRTLREYWLNFAVPRSELRDYDYYAANYGSRYRSVSLHAPPLVRDQLASWLRRARR
jgi:hypothetical protein